jgi:tRNA A37 threonylcarbamoyltransferase TsaD
MLQYICMRMNGFSCIIMTTIEQVAHHSIIVTGGVNSSSRVRNRPSDTKKDTRFSKFTLCMDQCVW